MQHTSLPFTLAFGPQGCMAEVKGRVVAVWCHAEWPRWFCGRVDFPQFIPHKEAIAAPLRKAFSDRSRVGIKPTALFAAKLWLAVGDAACKPVPYGSRCHTQPTCYFLLREPLVT